MEHVITRDLAIQAILRGACRIPEIGRRVSSLSTADLAWAEDNNLVPEEVKAQFNIPIWCLSDNGDGIGEYGDGGSDGSGYGRGYGGSDGENYGVGYKIIAEWLSGDTKES